MYIQLNGQILYYEKYGEGQPFLLVHGNGETHEIFDVLIPELAEHYTVYAIDSRGHGLSASPKELHYMDMADDMAAFIDALELKAPLFYGFSERTSKEETTAASAGNAKKIRILFPQ